MSPEDVAQVHAVMLEVHGERESRGGVPTVLPDACLFEPVRLGIIKHMETVRAPQGMPPCTCDVRVTVGVDPGVLAAICRSPLLLVPPPLVGACMPTCVLSMAHVVSLLFAPPCLSR